ncbi:MAG: hypothetical protein LBK24_01875 [Puniceicoccales bacterium]|nr:hypothetical protein [Puniceicoccales bacterium]
MVNFDGKEWGKVYFMALFLAWMHCSCLCNGSYQNGNPNKNRVSEIRNRHNWNVLTIENLKKGGNDLDLRDLERELLLIGTGKIWDCPLPVEDNLQGITEGKTIEEILEMLEEKYSPNACKDNYEKLQSRKYCSHRLNILSSLTFGKIFIRDHGEDVVGWDSELLKLFLERIVLRLCPSLKKLEMGWNLLPRWMLLEIADLKPHIENMIENKALKVRYNTLTKEREFSINLDKMGVIDSAFQDVCDAVKCQLDSTWIRDEEDSTPIYLHIRMAPCNFFKRIGNDNTLLETIFLRK